MPRGYNARLTTKNGVLELNGSAIVEMLYSPEVAGACTEIAQKIAERAGDGYEVEQMNGHDRKSAIVKPGTEEATRDNLKNNTLLKAVGQ